MTFLLGYILWKRADDIMNDVIPSSILRPSRSRHSASHKLDDEEFGESYSQLASGPTIDGEDQWELDKRLDASESDYVEPSDPFAMLYGTSFMPI